MSDTQNVAPKPTRDRSPSFPFIPLKTAIERLEALENYFGRHPLPTSKAGLAWGMKEKSSQAYQTLAALRSFGFVQYQGTGPSQQAHLTNEGRSYLRTQQESVKEQIAKQCALRPKVIRKYWSMWGADRPPTPVALDRLYEDGFSDAGAASFLKVYDETIGYAGLSNSDNMSADDDEAPGSGQVDADGDIGEQVARSKVGAPSSVSQTRRVTLMANERELTTGLLSKESSFRLIVSGEIGVREIERLIKKLELDKEILADPDNETPDFME